MDLIDASPLSQSVSLYLEPGYWSHIGSKATQIYAGGQITINFGTVIENAKGGKGDDFIVGNDANNHIWAMSGSDFIDGGDGDDIIECGEGKDVVRGLAGKDAIYGGIGEDRIFLTQSASEMQVIKLRDDAFIVTDSAGSNLAMCREVELIQFADGMRALADLPVSHQLDMGLVQIYVAAFQRAPELDGYSYWAQEAGSRGVVAVADTMFSLDTVKEIYPESEAPEKLVSSIYNNVFNRAPDADGLAYWIRQLDTKSRGELVLAMTSAALNAADGTPGKDYFENRLDWSLYAVEYQIGQGVGLPTEHLVYLTSYVDASTDVLVSLICQTESGLIM